MSLTVNDGSYLSNEKFLTFRFLFSVVFFFSVDPCSTAKFGIFNVKSTTTFVFIFIELKKDTLKKTANKQTKTNREK